MRALRDAFLVVAGLLSAIATPAWSAGDGQRGAALFRACAPCHSLKPDQNMTGPSLAGVWDRKAGSLASFDRYSPALKSSDIVWDDKSLDAWLKSPQSLVPHNSMMFQGISDEQQRADLIAFLKAASAGHAAVPAMGPGFQDLKKLGADRQVQAIRYCCDTYYVTTADGHTADFWEGNLRFKTDSGNTGPPAGKPVMMPAGMMGDRASVFFASPEEMSTFIKHQC
jgi:cytochrome c